MTPNEHLFSSTFGATIAALAIEMVKRKKVLNPVNPESYDKLTPEEYTALVICATKIAGHAIDAKDKLLSDPDEATDE